MDIEKLKKVVKESFNLTQVSEKLYGNRYYGNRETIKNYIKEFDIDTSHFTYRGKKPTSFTVKIPTEKILVENSTYVSTTTLKKRLYKEGLKERICEECGQGEEWRGKKMSLILDHRNGVNNDNRIENLRIVCPNCNATFKTHGGKNMKLVEVKKKPSEEEKKKNIIDGQIKQRKVERPSYNQLMMEIKIFGYKGTGERYGVSDNAIRKWKKYYENNLATPK